MPRASLSVTVLQFQSKPVDDDNTAVTRATGIICLLSHLKGTIVYHLYFLSEFSVLLHHKKPGAKYHHLYGKATGYCVSELYSHAEIKR